MHQNGCEWCLQTLLWRELCSYCPALLVLTLPEWQEGNSILKTMGITFKLLNGSLQLNDALFSLTFYWHHKDAQDSQHTFPRLTVDVSLPLVLNKVWLVRSGVEHSIVIRCRDWPEQNIGCGFCNVYIQTGLFAGSSGKKLVNLSRVDATSLYRMFRSVSINLHKIPNLCSSVKNESLIQTPSPHLATPEALWPRSQQILIEGMVQTGGWLWAMPSSIKPPITHTVSAPQDAKCHRQLLKQTACHNEIHGS